MPDFEGHAANLSPHGVRSVCPYANESITIDRVSALVTGRALSLWPDECFVTVPWVFENNF